MGTLAGVLPWGSVDLGLGRGCLGEPLLSMTEHPLQAELGEQGIYGRKTTGQSGSAGASVGLASHTGSSWCRISEPVAVTTTGMELCVPVNNADALPAAHSEKEHHGRGVGLRGRVCAAPGRPRPRSLPLHP